MSSIKKILVPFDFTKPAQTALDYALHFVGWENAIEVIPLYVSSMQVSDAEKEKAKQDFAQITDSLERITLYPPKLLILEGDLTTTILEARRTLEAQLVIMGTAGNSGVGEYVTHTSHLVLREDGPVIAVPMDATIQKPKEIALVLCSEELEDRKVLDTLLDIARLFDAKVHALTIYKESIYKEKVLVEQTENTLEYYLEHFYAERTFERNEDVEEGILNYVRDKEIDLLAILPRNHAKKTTPSEGRLTKLLALHSSVPVLTLD